MITGASAGLGAEFARLCAARGESLVLVARRRDRLESLAEELGGAEIVAMDLAPSGAPERLIAEVEGLGLHVDCLINNAGFGLVGRFAALQLARQREMIGLNIGALTKLAHLVLPGIIERRSGRILNVASTAAIHATRRYPK